MALKNNIVIVGIVLLTLVAALTTGCDKMARQGLIPTQTPTETPKPAPVEEADTIGEPTEVFDDTPAGYLAARVAEFDRVVYVFRDGADIANRFPRQVWMGSEETANIPLMDETAEGLDGSTAIGVTLDFDKHSWGGYYFEPSLPQEGSLDAALADRNENSDEESLVLPAEPAENMTGAKRVSFWAKGENGGENVEFFVGGQGWDGFRPAEAADSVQKISIGIATLTTEWERYEISLEYTDLSRISGGFAWVANDRNNAGVSSITFYLDNIRYEFEEVRDKPVLLTSYAPAIAGTDNAIIYDNAMTAIALSRAGYPERARKIADAIVNLCAQGEWRSTTGNLAWAMLALCEIAEKSPEQTEYVNTAEQIADVILAFKSDTGKGGFTAGYEFLGSDKARATYKSTEHNIDAYAAFGRLAALVADSDAEAADIYEAASLHARDFVLSMVDARHGCIFTGTTANGATINRDVVPLDCQTWAALALGDALTPEQKAAAMAYAETKMRVADTDGYDFNTDRDGVWFEGTAQAALAYDALGDTERRDAILAYLAANEEENGSIAAADRDNVTTGFFIIGTGLPWVYGKHVHIGATAWLALAEMGENPFIPAD